MYRPGNVPIEEYAVIRWCFLKGWKLQLNNIYIRNNDIKLM